ncbi:MAG: efflux RND transporter periplasmic adaptor subunit [Verrucomicrobia bacterium]|nr:efflux RND transporter periplasmic adaptor subunit [Verrucomicrobiota bacterium]
MAKSRGVSSLLLILVPLLLLGGGAYWYWNRGGEKLPDILTATVGRGDIVQAVTSTGDLQPVVTTEVSSQISGQIIEVAVDFNSRVKRGDVLARLDTATYDSRLRQAEAQLANTRANHTLSKLNVERARTLFGRNLVSQQELDQSEAQFEQTSAQLLIQTASVENARTDLSRCTIYAPIDGIVIDRVAEVGKTVAASFNAPTLFTLVNDLAQMQIKAAVAEADIGSVEVGQDVTFTVDAFPNRQFRGKVEQLRNLPTTTQNVVTYATIINVRNDDLRLKPGMTANVSIVIARRGGALRIPNAALRARIPEAYQIPKPAATGAPAPAVGATGTSSAPAAGGAAAGGGASAGAGKSGGESRPGGDRREQFRQLMADAGVDFRSGPPAPEALTRLQALARERGIELPERFMGGRGGNGGAGAAGTVTTRTVYKLAGTPAKPLAEPVSVKLGITDGSFTEVIEGLAEGDVLISSFAAPEGNAANQPARNPFSGGRRPF